MAHAEKYKRDGIVGMAIHYERREGCELTNKNIDIERSHLNYNLAHELQPLRPEKFIAKRLNEVKHINRKDIVVMVNWVVSLPKNVPVKDEKSFFELTYDFIKSQYGEENIVGAWVHNDESTPHIHVSFVPVIKEDNIEKLNCKKLLTRQTLREFHPSLGAFLEQSLGYLPEVQNGATVNGNRTVKELKNKEDLSLKKSLSNIHKHIEVSERISQKTNSIKYEQSSFLEKPKSLKKCHIIIDELKHINKELRNDNKSLTNLITIQKKEIDLYREMPLSKRLTNKQEKINELCSSIKKLEAKVDNYQNKCKLLDINITNSSRKIKKLEGVISLYEKFIFTLGLDRAFAIFKREYTKNNTSIDTHVLKDICKLAYEAIGKQINKIVTKLNILNKKQLPTENIKIHHKKKKHSIEDI
ncbi:MobV family relaxase [Thomasclavelia sp.]